METPKEPEIILTTIEEVKVAVTFTPKHWTMEDLREVFPKGDGSIVDSLLTIYETQVETISAKEKECEELRARLERAYDVLNIQR